jgi:hypothetical protein
MRLLPPRRWFQFRLSTWLLLIAILCWAMSARPYARSYWSLVSVAPVLGMPRDATVEGRQILGNYPGDLDNPDFPEWLQAAAEPVSSKNRSAQLQLENHVDINPRLRYPAAALLAFIHWKAAGAFRRFVVSHNRDRYNDGHGAGVRTTDC